MTLQNKVQIYILTLLWTTTIITQALTPSWPNPYWNIPGDYCRAKYEKMNCCNGRQDPCSVEILGTLCYCDTFCNRTDNSDCCPDYFTHCAGLQEPEPLTVTTYPPQSACTYGSSHGEDPKCHLDGKYYSVRDTTHMNCNHCKCQVSLSNPNCMDWMCETEECLIDIKVYDNLIQSQTTLDWIPSNYSQFWGRTLQEGLNGKLGTESTLPVQMAPIRFSYKPRDLPREFDSRAKWTNLNNHILDQGWCGASWAFSTASVASDRFLIDSKGKTDENLCPRSIIACNTHGQSGCKGGSVDRAWSYLRKYGTVPQSCSSYHKDEDPMKQGCILPRLSHYPLMSTPLEEKFEIFKTCPAVAKRQSLFKMQPAYKVGRKNTLKYPRRTEYDIMYEIMTHGPVQATMEVYRDFFLYNSGIYSKTQLVSEVLGFHSVKIVGWGEENGIPFWNVVNSWGRDWGELGHFKIRRGINECLIETFVIGAWAQTDKHLKQLRQFRLMQRMRRAKRHHGAGRRHHKRRHSKRRS